MQKRLLLLACLPIIGIASGYHYNGYISLGGGASWIKDNSVGTITDDGTTAVVNGGYGAEPSAEVDAGVHINDDWRVEFGFRYFFDYTDTKTEVIVVNREVRGEEKSSGYQVNLKFLRDIHFTKSFDCILGAGAAYTHFNRSLRGVLTNTAVPIVISDTTMEENTGDVGFLATAGFGYRFNNKNALRAMYDYVTGDSRGSTVMLQYSYTFV